MTKTVIGKHLRFSDHGYQMGSILEAWRVLKKIPKVAHSESGNFSGLFTQSRLKAVDGNGRLVRENCR